MEKLKYFFLILCVSFTMVIMINVGLIELGVLSIILSTQDIISMFMVCFIIALLCIILDMIPKIRDYPMIYSYIVVMSVAMGMQYMVYPHYFWDSLMIQPFLLTVVYLVVWGVIYLNDRKNVESINQKIKNER